MQNNELDELFDLAEQDAAAFIEARRIKLLKLVGMYELGAVGEDEL